MPRASPAAVPAPSQGLLWHGRSRGGAGDEQVPRPGPPSPAFLCLSPCSTQSDSFHAFPASPSYSALGRILTKHQQQPVLNS